MKELISIFEDYNFNYIADSLTGAVTFINATPTSLIALIHWKVYPVIDIPFVLIISASVISILIHVGLYLYKTKINRASAVLICLFEYITMLGIELGLFNLLTGGMKWAYLKI